MRWRFSHWPDARSRADRQRHLWAAAGNPPTMRKRAQGGRAGWGNRGNRGGGGSHPHPAGYISHMTIGALWHLLLAGGLLTPWNRQKAAAVYRIMQISRQSSGPYRNDKPIESTWISLSTSAAAAPAVNFILSLSLCLSLCLSLLKMLFSILPSSLLFSSFLFFVVGFWFRNWKFQVSCWGWVGGGEGGAALPAGGMAPGPRRKQRWRICRDQSSCNGGSLATLHVLSLGCLWHGNYMDVSNAPSLLLPPPFLPPASPLPPPCLLLASLPPYLLPLIPRLSADFNSKLSG